MKLYKYTGTISEVSFRNRTACDIKLYDMNDRDKAPTRLEVVGALGKYIRDIEGTDAEERYIPNDFYFDDKRPVVPVRRVAPSALERTQQIPLPVDNEFRVESLLCSHGCRCSREPP